MKALIVEGAVAQIEEDGDVFEVHPSFVWVDCPAHVNTGWKFDGETFWDPKMTFEALDEEFRIYRMEQLNSSDWTQVNDCPLGHSDVQSWKAFRQSLRNFPSTDGYPFRQFPEAPQVG